MSEFPTNSVESWKEAQAAAAEKLVPEVKALTYAGLVNRASKRADETFSNLPNVARVPARTVYELDLLGRALLHRNHVNGEKISGDGAVHTKTVTAYELARALAYAQGITGEPKNVRIYVAKDSVEFAFRQVRDNNKMFGDDTREKFNSIVVCIEKALGRDIEVGLPRFQIDNR